MIISGLDHARLSLNRKMCALTNFRSSSASIRDSALLVLPMLKGARATGRHFAFDHHKRAECTCQREPNSNRHDHAKAKDEGFIDRLFQSNSRLIVNGGRQFGSAQLRALLI